MNAKEFERICKYRMEQEEKKGLAIMSRYGVQARLLDGKWQPISSYPDFEGVTSDGRQFIFDAKVCSQASFPLKNDDKYERQQRKHMFKRSRFNVTCFYLIHFPERRLLTRVDDPVTVAFPVTEDHHFWASFITGEAKRITRDDCYHYGITVQWNAPEKTRTPRPDILQAVLDLRCCAGNHAA